MPLILVGFKFTDLDFAKERRNLTEILGLKSLFKIYLGHWQFSHIITG